MKNGKHPQLKPLPKDGTVEVPGVGIEGAQVKVVPYPKDPTMKCILVGPIFLAVPFTREGALPIIKGLTDSGAVILPGKDTE